MEAAASNLIFMIKQMLFFLLLCVQWLAFPVYGQFVFKGKVVSQDSIALQGVSISINNKVLAISDAIGYFEFSYAADKATVRFSSIGYQATSSFFSTKTQDRSVEKNIIIS